MIENKDRMMTQEKAKKERDEVKDCTFKPNTVLTKKSTASRNEQKRRAVSQIEVQGANWPVNMIAPRYEELYEKGKEKDDKLRLMREEKEKEAIQEHKFKPKIN